MVGPGRSIVNVVIGTAGHIDHGKTSLVKRITGVDPDRLKEEQERGMTIDLGFAPWRLSDGRVVGFIDVPGHERFVKNMVAGASGIDIVVLVVAADDGIMPQTREHLEIMKLMGLTRGLVAVTKIDAVEAEMVELVIEELRDYLAGSFLDGTPLLPCSSHTGEGIVELERALLRLIDGASAREPGDLFRMSVQRVFSARGHGTVLTGVPVSGRVRRGDVLELLPAGRRGKVRGLHAYGEPVEEGRAGHSTAINLADVDYKEAQRGMVLATPGHFFAARLLEARFQALKNLPRPLDRRTRVRCHTGTAEALGELVLLSAGRLEGGQEALVQLRLDDPVVIAPGDRYVLRLETPLRTLGGGLILGQTRWRLKAGKEQVLERLREKEAALADERGFVETCLRAAQARPLTLDELVAATALAHGKLTAILTELETAGRAHALTRPQRWLHEEGAAALGARVLAVVEAYHRRSPLRLAMPTSQLAAVPGVGAELADFVAGRLLSRGELEQPSRGKLRRAGFRVAFDPGQEALRGRIEERFREARFQAPRREELPALLGASAEALEPLFEHLLDEGRIASLAEGIYLHAPVLDEARAAVVEHLGVHGTISAAQLRDLFDTSRKFAIPFLEHLDALGVTVRDGDVRRLR